MALKSKSSSTELPEGAVLVSEKEALKYQKNLVQDWPLESDVFCLKFGSILTGAVTLISSALIQNHFRVFFRADLKIIGVTFIPGLAVPFYFSKVFTDRTVTDNILLMKVKCPMCMNAKFALQLFYSSFLFPSLYACSAYAMYADFRGTYTFPSFQKHPSKFWKEFFKAFKSGSKTFQIVGLMQSVIIFFLPYWQQRELHKISIKLEDKQDSELLLN